jgi:CRP/FNR family transcriptional regulator, cyclic AMP receptor protein
MHWSDLFAYLIAKWPELLGYVAASCTLVAYSMRTMIPLRIAGITANFLFIGFGYLEPSYPTLVLHTLLLPLNSLRLYQMVQLTKKIEAAASGDLSMNWLKPFMTDQACKAGDILFRRGDVATELYYTLSGKYQLEETGITIPSGEIVGEIAFVMPGEHRTQTLKCLEDGHLLTIGYPQVRQLYFQNPTFGFYFLQLTSGRLFKNIEKLEAALAQAKASAEAKPVVQLGGS